MPQFDVHRNTGRQRETIPFVVVVQSSLYKDYRRRVVVPLVRKELLGSIPDPSFNPTFTIESVDPVGDCLHTDWAIGCLGRLVVRGWRSNHPGYRSIAEQSLAIRVSYSKDNH